MRWFPFLLIALSLFPSCKHDEVLPTEQAMNTLKTALVSLHNHDFDDYLQHVDDITGMDSIQLNLMSLLLEQHQDWQDQEKGAVAEINMSEVEMSGDSVCTVFYELVFADSTREVSSQKMVLNHDGAWRIRLRN